MTTTAPRPLICVSANSRPPDDRRRLPTYATAERYVQSLLKMVDCIPDVADKAEALAFRGDEPFNRAGCTSGPSSAGAPATCDGVIAGPCEQ